MMPSATKQLLGIPFARGLSQREDPRWLGSGALITGQNAVHVKTNIVQKRPGASGYTTTGLASVPGQSATMSLGKRLASLDRRLAAIAQLSGFGDALWTFTESGSTATPVFKDLVPEVYGFPPRVLAGGSGVVLDMDSCLCNGWLVHVWLYGIALTPGAPSPVSGGIVGTDVYYQVENASTGEVLIPARSIGQVPSSHGAVAPKIVACGTTAILTYVTGSNDYSLYATALDLTNPTSAWVTAQAIVALPAPPISLTSGNTGTGPYMGVYDMDSVLGDTAHYLVCAAVGTTGAGSSASHIKLYQCSVANTLSVGTIVVTSTNLEANDSVWTGDSPNNTLSAIAIRGDASVSPNGVLIAYGWQTATPTLRVSAQVVQYPTIGTAIGTAVNLLTVPGTAFPSTADAAPQWIAVDRQSSTGYHVYFSPAHAFWDAGFANVSPQATTYIADYFIFPNSGVMAITTGQPRTTFGLRLASRSIQRNGIGYVMGWLPSQTEGTYFLMANDAWADATTAANVAFPLRLVGTFTPRLASGPALFWNQTPEIPPFASFTLPHLVSNPNGGGGDVVYGLFSVTQGQVTVTEPNVLSWDFASALNFQPAQLGPNLGLACAAPSAFDGKNVFEFGFPYSPFIVSAVENTGGSLVPGDTYNYIVCYEKRDAAGLKHRSPRSRVFTHTMGAGKTALSLSVATMGFSAREKAPGAVAGHGPQGLTSPETPIMIKVYRTAAGGLPPYTSLDPVDYVSPPGGSDITVNSTAARYNVTNTTTLTVGDGSADATIASNEEVYDDGGDGTQPGSIVNNVCPPGFQALVAHQSRLFGINGNDVWPSKAFTTGEGAGFNEEFNFTLDDGPGYLTAAASLDDKLILFKRDRLYFMTGFGPNDNGGSNDWSPPQRIASDTGAIDWRSVVVTPQGCFFMSDGGLRLLTRDLQVQNVTNVEDLLTTNPAVSSAILHPTQNRVLWTANTDDVSNPRTGIGLDHDYVLDSWMSSVSNDGNAIQGATSATVANALVSGALVPTYYWIRSGGIVCRETPGAFYDAAFFFGGQVYSPMTIETAWIKSDALESFARFRRLMVTWTASDGFSLSVSVAYDYNPTYYLMGTITAAQMSAMPNFPTCQELFALPRQRAQSVRFKITDAANGTTTTGAGPVLVSLGLEWMQYTNRRLARVPAAQRT